MQRSQPLWQHSPGSGARGGDGRPFFWPSVEDVSMWSLYRRRHRLLGVSTLEFREQRIGLEPASLAPQSADAFDPPRGGLSLQLGFERRDIGRRLARGIRTLGTRRGRGGRSGSHGGALAN